MYFFYQWMHRESFTVTLQLPYHALISRVRLLRKPASDKLYVLSSQMLQFGFCYGFTV